VPPTPRWAIQRRRLAAALVLLGLAFLVSAVGPEFLRPTGDAQLDTRSQSERVLPVPAPGRIIEPRVNPRRARGRQPVRQVLTQLPRPIRLSIPAIGVSAPIVPLGLNDDGTAETPESTTEAGWFAPGPEPGEKGAAVVIGHVDSYRGPGVFYHLRALRPGDRITVVLGDRRRARFVVTGSTEAPKTRFPTQVVFRRTQRPTLRLVTCGGRFDRATHHYVDNYIVFAHLAQV
jgi:sortase (surface protein transpeptidase)